MCHENVSAEILVSSYGKTGAIAMAFDRLRSLGDFLEASRGSPQFHQNTTGMATHGYTWLHMATHGLHMGYTWATHGYTPPTFLRSPVAWHVIFQS